MEQQKLSVKQAALKAAIHELLWNENDTDDFLYNYELEADPRDLACDAEQMVAMKRQNAGRIAHDEALLLRFVLAQRREAVEQARPEIERAARIEALEWIEDRTEGCDWDDAGPAIGRDIDKEITRLKAEGGEND